MECSTNSIPGLTVYRVIDYHEDPSNIKRRGEIPRNHDPLDLVHVSPGSGAA